MVERLLEPKGRGRVQAVVVVSDTRQPNADERAAKWETFALLRTVIEQSSSSLRTEALIKLDELQERVRDAEALGDV